MFELEYFHEKYRLKIKAILFHLIKEVLSIEVNKRPSTAKIIEYM
jgi:hypothetical protein